MPNPSASGQPSDPHYAGPWMNYGITYSTTGWEVSLISRTFCQEGRPRFHHELLEVFRSDEACRDFIKARQGNLAPLRRPRPDLSGDFANTEG